MVGGAYVGWFQLLAGYISLLNAEPVKATYEKINTVTQLQVNDEAFQDLWKRQRKRTRLQRWFTAFSVASILVAWFSAPYLGTYFVADSVAPIIKESLKDRASGSDKTRRFHFSEAHLVNEFTGELNRKNIPFEVRHTAGTPYVIKLSEEHVLFATEVLNLKGIQPDYTDVSLEVDERSLTIEATTTIYK